MALSLSPEAKRRWTAAVQRYFRESFEEEIGDLQAALLLDFVLREVGPAIYNRAIADARAYFHERVEDLEGTCHAPDPGYWGRR